MSNASSCLRKLSTETVDGARRRSVSAGGLCGLFRLAGLRKIYRLSSDVNWSANSEFEARLPTFRRVARPIRVNHLAQVAAAHLDRAEIALI